MGEGEYPLHSVWECEGGAFLFLFGFTWGLPYLVPIEV
jgi:hypothetical protein